MLRQGTITAARQICLPVGTVKRSVEAMSGAVILVCRLRTPVDVALCLGFSRGQFAVDGRALRLYQSPPDGRDGRSCLVHAGIP